MDLIVVPVLTSLSAIFGALILGRIRGVAARAEGKMARALARIPDGSDRERWQEELRRVLLEFEGRPIKQYQESKQLVRAAERLVDVYRPSPQSENEIAREAGSLDPVPRFDRAELVEALENLSYRERRILELSYGLGGEDEQSAEEIGERFKVSTDRVSTIESQALKKILNLIEAQKLRDT